MSVLKITHNAGFFSCMTIRLEKILEYVNQYHQLPEIIDSSAQFYYYKSVPNSRADITHKFIKDTLPFSPTIDQNPIRVTDLPDEQQFSDYSKLNYTLITPFISKYFSVSDAVDHQVKIMEDKYQIQYDQLCVLFYRGLAKYWETQLASYDEYIDKAKEITKPYPNMRILLQSDETEFFDIAGKKLTNTFIFKDEISHTSRINAERIPDVERSLPYHKRIDHAIKFLAIVKIMAKAKYVVTYSGNAGLWICLYRGNSKGVYQYIHHKKEIFGVENKSFNPSQTNYWQGELCSP